MHGAEPGTAGSCRTVRGPSETLRPLRPDGPRIADHPATVTFVAPDRYELPVGALRRILKLMVAEAACSAGMAAS